MKRSSARAARSARSTSRTGSTAPTRAAAPPTGGGRKHDQGKPRWDLLPWGPLEEVAAVLEFGARKYAPGNWKLVRGARWRYLRAGLGHLAARARGEVRDPESGLPHLAHAVCCCLFLMWFDRKGK